MNKLTIYSRTLTVATVIILGAAASIHTVHAQTSTDLVGTWSADFQKMNNASNYPPGSDYNALPEQSQAMIREAFESRIFTFNSDQTITISFSVGGNNRHVTGTWSYEATNNLLAIQVNGETVEFQSSLQDGALTMEPLVQQPNAVFESLSFTKN